MSDYISRDAVMWVYDEMNPGVPVVGGQGRWEVMGEKLKAIPVADVAHVVRCKDCKFGEADYHDFHCCIGYGLNKAGFYCAYGKRKDAEVE